MIVEPYAINVPDAALSDLRARLADTRWPDPVYGAGWSSGMDHGFLQPLVGYWHAGYDWREQERRLNGFPNFRARIADVDLHFVHVRGRGPRPVPLLMNHGWPSTFAEMIRVIEPLADPAAHGGDAGDAFDVIVPSLPGYGFSARSRTAGMNVAQISEVLLGLMVDALGYERFGVHGGDWGSDIAHWLGYAYEERVMGISVTQLVRRRIREPLGVAPRRRPEDASPGRRDTGFLMVQRTRPDAVSQALNDSPAGLAAWIIDKFHAWGDPGHDVGGFDQVYTRDHLLTTATIYWVTETIGSANRLYFEDYHRPARLPKGRRIEVPMGAFLPARPDGTLPTPAGLEQNYADVRRWCTVPTRGHFTALEQPEALVEEIRALFRPLRGRSARAVP